MHRLRPTSPIILRLAAEACRDPRTVILAIQGSASPLVRASVIAAAQRLGLSGTDPIMQALTSDPTTTKMQAR